MSDRLEAYATLAFVLGRTSSITGAVTVTNLPSRSAPLLARTVSSLQELSGGRVILGIGSGGMWDSIVKMGVPRLSPGAAVREMEEAITLVRALCGGGEPVTFDGEFYRVSGLDPSPVAAPLIWTGSNRPKSLAVTGRLADGWVPMLGADWLSPVFREQRPLIDAAAVAAGREPAEIASIFNCGGLITRDPLSSTRDPEGRWIGGSVDQWVQEMSIGVREHGAAGFVYREPGDRSPSSAEAAARWAREIVPAVREAVAR